MPLPNVTSGASKQCRARTKSRNLEPCLNLAAFGTPVCKVHGAVHPDKRAKVKSHGRYTHGSHTQDKVAARKEQGAVIRNFEDILFLLGAIEGNQHTRGGNLPLGYEKITTIEQAKEFIMKLENSEHE
jgi:hypothetical protein